MADKFCCRVHESGGELFYVFHYRQHRCLLKLEHLRQVSPLFSKIDVANLKLHDLVPRYDLSSLPSEAPNRPCLEITKEVFEKFVYWLQGTSLENCHPNGRRVTGLRTVERYIQMCAIAHCYNVSSLWNWSMYEIAQLQGKEGHLGHRERMEMAKLFQVEKRIVKPYTISEGDSHLPSCRYILSSCKGTEVARPEGSLANALPPKDTARPTNEEGSIPAKEKYQKTYPVLRGGIRWENGTLMKGIEKQPGLVATPGTKASQHVVKSLDQGQQGLRESAILRRHETVHEQDKQTNLAASALLAMSGKHYFSDLRTDPSTAKIAHKQKSTPEDMLKKGRQRLMDEENRQRQADLRTKLEPIVKKLAKRREEKLARMREEKRCTEQARTAEQMNIAGLLN